MWPRDYVERKRTMQMLIASNAPIDIVKSMKVGDMAMVEFKDYRKFRSFLVQLSDFNSIFGHERNIFVHAASKKRKLQYYLVVTFGVIGFSFGVSRISFGVPIFSVCFSNSIAKLLHCATALSPFVHISPH